MSKVYLIAEEGAGIQELCDSLNRAGHACTLLPDAASLPVTLAEDDTLLVQSASQAGIAEISRRVKKEHTLPVIGLLPDNPGLMDGGLDSVDDFVFKPWNAGELDFRIRRLLRRLSGVDGGENIGCGDVIIDVAGYQVFVAGRPVELTFKEYELLRFLASNKDRAFTREALLNKVWGYDYYGGDRTVDVHVQRLRAKIEGSKNVSIETVRNIGYRLKTSSC